MKPISCVSVFSVIKTQVFFLFFVIDRLLTCFLFIYIYFNNSIQSIIILLINFFKRQLCYFGFNDNSNATNNFLKCN